MGANWRATMLSLNPAAWWRLGETSGTIAYEEIHRRAGTYVNAPQLSQIGATHDGNTGAAFLGYKQQYVTVPDDDVFSLVIANDGFERSGTLAGWGTAAHGGNWGPQVTTSLSYYKIKSNFPLSEDSWGQILMTTTGTFQIGLPTVIADGEIQVSCMWDAHPSTGFTDVASIVARMQDVDNMYRAILKERPDHSLELSIVKTVGGVSTILAAVNVGIYTLSEWWVIRTQWDGSNLKARAWPVSATQPTDWQVVATDTAFSTGTVSLRASNSGSGTGTTVSFNDFWVQRLGLTVHAWMRVDLPKFTEADGGEKGGAPTIYCHWLGKGEDPTTGKGQLEYTLRLYSNTVDPDDDRHGRVSAYIFNQGGNLGSGDAWQPGLSTDPRDNLDPDDKPMWHQYVAVFPAGDYLDTQARVKLYRDAYWQQGNTDIDKFKDGPGPGSLYSDKGHPIWPANGSAPLRMATRDGNSFLTGAIDDVAIFHRVLSQTDIQKLFDAAQ